MFRSPEKADRLKTSIRWPLSLLYSNRSATIGFALVARHAPYASSLFDRL